MDYGNSTPVIENEVVEHKEKEDFISTVKMLGDKKM